MQYITPEYSQDIELTGWTKTPHVRSSWPIVSPEQLKNAPIKVIDQKSLTSECLVVQIIGLSACESCQYKNKPRRCGGKKIRGI